VCSWNVATLGVQLMCSKNVATLDVQLESLERLSMHLEEFREIICVVRRI
jgi:hypothetical protein